MGLGPPVCEKCRVVVTLLESPIDFVSDDVWKRTWWQCKYCGNKEPAWNAWDCDLTEKELDDNERFLAFVTGQQDAT